MAELVVFGASNAGGWSEAHSVEYHCSNILGAVYDNSPVVKNSPNALTIDLSLNPNLNENDWVINQGFPGDTTIDLFRRFRSDVLEKAPRRVFIWPGLNDVSQILSIWNRDDESMPYDQDDSALRFATLLKSCRRIDEVYEVAGYFIGIYLKNMVKSAEKTGVETFIGTLPPFGSRLCRFGNQPPGDYLLKEGPRFIDVINLEIGNLRPKARVLDIHRALLNPQTGLMRAEFSYGESQQSGDVLHLNNRGQIQVAAMLANALFNKPVRIIPSEGGDISWGK